MQDSVQKNANTVSSQNQDSPSLTSSDPLTVSDPTPQTLPVPSGKKLPHMPIKARAIIAPALQAKGNQWMSSTDIQQACPELSTAMVYTSLSGLKAHGVIEATDGRPAKYRLTLEWLNWSPGEPDPVAHAEPARATETSDAVVTPAVVQAPEPAPQPVPQSRPVILKQSHVHWTDEEKRAVAEAVIELRTVTPYLPTLNAYHEAQGALPEERRKVAKHLGEINWLIALIDKIKKEPRPLPKEPQGTVEKAVGGDISEATVSRPSPVPEIATTDLISMLLGRAMTQGVEALREVLAQSVADGIMIALRSGEAAEIMNRIAERRELPREIGKHNPLPISPDRTRLKRVLLTGLPVNEMSRVDKEFKGLLDVRYWTNKANRLLIAMAKNADVILLMVNQISHSTESTLKHENVPYTRVTGGVNQAIDALTEVYANG